MNMADLYINEKEASDFGVHMGEGFLSALDTPASLKEFIENESRLEDGKRIIVHEIRRASRELTLKFVITGKSTAEFTQNKQRLMEELDKGVVEIQVPALGGQVYNLIYRGQSIQYGLSRSRKTATLSARFEEPNPTDRKIK